MHQASLQQAAFDLYFNKHVNTLPCILKSIFLAVVIHVHLILSATNKHQEQVIYFRVSSPTEEFIRKVRHNVSR